MPRPLVEARRHPEGTGGPATRSRPRPPEVVFSEARYCQKSGKPTVARQAPRSTAGASELHLVQSKLLEQVCHLALQATLGCLPV